MKSKVNLRNAQDRAINIFTPQKMITKDRLKRLDDHTVIFDRTTIPKDEESQFFIILALDYQWRYKQKFDNVTVYYEVDADGNIMCGVYDMVDKKKITKKVLISNLENAHYTYTEEITKELSKIIIDT